MAQEITKFGVFIIESMDLKNETNKKLDGFALKTILDLSDIPNKYFYVRTKLELEYLVEEFKESKYRYLHIACHGNAKGLSLCIEDVLFSELDEILGEDLKYRRLFLSSCKSTRFELAEYFIPHYHCFSVIGTPKNIDYDKAAIFWSSFYYLMYLKDKKKMSK
jgi:hypothetical protein